MDFAKVSHFITKKRTSNAQSGKMAKLISTKKHISVAQRNTLNSAEKMNTVLFKLQPKDVKECAVKPVQIMMSNNHNSIKGAKNILDLLQNIREKREPSLHNINTKAVTEQHINLDSSDQDKLPNGFKSTSILVEEKVDKNVLIFHSSKENITENSCYKEIFNKILHKEEIDSEDFQPVIIKVEHPVREMKEEVVTEDSKEEDYIVEELEEIEEIEENEDDFGEVDYLEEEEELGSDDNYGEETAVDDSDDCGNDYDHDDDDFDARARIIQSLTLDPRKCVLEYDMTLKRLVERNIVVEEEAPKERADCGTQTGAPDVERTWNDRSLTRGWIRTRHLDIPRRSRIHFQAIGCEKPQEKKVEKTEKKSIKRKCRVCSFTTRFLSKMREHYREKHKKEYKTKDLSCAPCATRFPTGRDLREHCAKYHDNETSLCEYCGGLYKGLADHISSRHVRSEKKCNKCGVTFESIYAFKKHHREPGTGVQCEVCGAVFKAKHILRVHMVRHGEKKIECGLCAKKFFSKGDLSKHLFWHTGRKDFKCETCGKAFSGKYALQKHEKIHTGDRSYSCEVCGKKFLQKIHVKVHMRVHTGVRPYSCNICRKTFRHSTTLAGHKKVHATIKEEDEDEV